jgi:hypothetical protein
MNSSRDASHIKRCRTHGPCHHSHQRCPRLLQQGYSSLVASGLQCSRPKMSCQPIWHHMDTANPGPRPYRKMAKSPACRGLATTTGSPAAARAAVTGSPSPPVASSTIRVGWKAYKEGTRAAMSASWFGTVRRSALGRRATSQWACAPSMPTETGGWLIESSFPGARPCAMRARSALGTVRALMGRAVTTRALPRSLATSGASV